MPGACGGQGPAADITSRAAAVVAWLRDHPAVESGPSVRAAQAMTDLGRAWMRLTGDDGRRAPSEFQILRVALLTLPHRVSVLPGVDPDDLVRQAVDFVFYGDEDNEQSRPAAGMRRRRNPFAIEEEPAGDNAPKPRAGTAGGAVLSAVTIERLLADLLVPARVWSPQVGPRPVLPARRIPGEEALAPVPYSAGDRSRDLSIRHSLRAAVRAGGGLDPSQLRVLVREPTTRYDVVLAVDVSASMADPETAFAVAAARTLAGALVRSGHRVGMVAFAEVAVVAQALTRDRRRLGPEEYEFGRSTNIEAGLDTARRLLAEGSVTGHRRRIILVSDAEATSFTNPPPPPSGTPARPMAARYPGRAGHPLRDARRAALLAAARCAREEILVSVAHPGGGPGRSFAHLLATAGGGVVRALGFPSRGPVL